MDKEIKKEARKQYFHYFRFWFIGIAVLFVLVLGGMVWSRAAGKENKAAPEKRVYDYADVLSDTEEEKLEKHIASCENKYHIHLVVLTVLEDMEILGSSWNYEMMNYADNFYDDNQFGYDKIRGDGALLLDNWYKGQEGSWLSTCGRVYRTFSDSDIDRVLDTVYNKVEDSPYEAYKAYVDEVCRRMKSSRLAIPWWLIVILPLLVAVFYAVSHLHQKKAEDTTRADTYVPVGSRQMNVSTDNFIRKNTVTRRIETSSSGSGGGRSGGGGGHVSRSGVSHGGGGRRR